MKMPSLSGMAICSRCYKMAWIFKYITGINCECGATMVPVAEEIWDMWKNSEYYKTMRFNEFVRKLGL
jgi:hypothetical protein